MLKIDYVNNKSIEEFHGDLKIFDQIRLLADVQDSVVKSSEQARELKQNALRKVREYASNYKNLSRTVRLDKRRVKRAIRRNNRGYYRTQRFESP